MKVLIAIVCVVVVFFVWEFIANRINGVKNISAVKIGDTTVRVELADTAVKRAKGLMFRKSLEKDSGMLFVFPTEGKHSFWMANTYIPLDIIWIGSDMKIVHIEENVQPCVVEGSTMDKLRDLCRVYTPSENAKYVLEVNGGWVKENAASKARVEFINK